MTKTADVVVIGGGVNGVSAAYHLAKLGVEHVVLVEKDHIASGPTGLSSGIVRQHYTLETLSKMARDSVRVFQDFKDVIGGDAGFVQSGVAFIGSGEGATVLQETVAMHRSIGIDERLLSAGELQELEPALNVDDVLYGAYETGGGYADPSLTANSYCQAAVREGVEILRSTEVTGIALERGRVRGAITAKGTIATESIVNVAGPWGARIAGMVGAEIPISPSRHPVLVLERAPNWRSPTPVWGDLVTGWYFKPEGAHGIMVGCLSENEEDRNVDVDGYAAKVQPDETVRYSEAIVHRFPVMLEGSATASWAGLYDVTPDGLPVIDAVPQVAGFYCAVGFSGHGFKTAPAVGRILAELVTTGASQTYDIELFRYDRFKEKKLEHSRYAYHIIG